jgi:hypothetical protein
MSTQNYINIQNIPIILHTMDSYSKYWNYWWHFTKKYCNHKNIIFASENIDPEFKNEVSTFKTGKGEWGKRLITILDSINKEYIFYMQEDFWPTKNFPYTQEKINKFINDNADCWRICEHSSFYNINQIEEDLYQYSQNSLYTLSHQFSLWKVSFLRQFINENETPWENELNGSTRVNLTPHKIYFQPNCWYETTVRQGNLQLNGINLLKKEKIND